MSFWRRGAFGASQRARSPGQDPAVLEARVRRRRSWAESGGLQGLGWPEGPCHEGLVGSGEGWEFIPKEVDTAVFFGVWW